MAALDFPLVPTTESEVTTGDITWKWNGYAWYSITDSTNNDVYLSKVDNDTAAGEITFAEKSIHEDGIRSNGTIVSIKSEGFPQDAGSWSKFADFEGNIRTSSDDVLPAGLALYNYRRVDGVTNQQTDVVLIDHLNNLEDPIAAPRCYIRFNSSAPDNGGGYIAFGGLGDAISVNKPAVKIHNISNGLGAVTGDTTTVATFTYPAGPSTTDTSALRDLKFVSSRTNDGSTANQMGLDIEATRGKIRFDPGNADALGFYWTSDGTTWTNAGKLRQGTWTGLSFRSVDIELDGDQETAFTTSYSTDENGEQVEVQTYNGETQTLQSIIRELKTRIDQLESNTLQPLYATLADLPSATDHHGKVAHVHAEGALYFAHAGNWVKLQNA